MNRRTFLKTSASIGAIATAATAGGYTLTQPGAAQVSGNLNINDSSAQTDDGKVSAVTVNLSQTVSWDGFDIPVAAIAYRDTIEIAPNSDVPVTSTLYDNTDNPVNLENWSSSGSGSDGWGGAGEYIVAQQRATEEEEEGEIRATEGKVHADINWVVVSDGSVDANSVESPALAGLDIINADPDNTDESTILRYTKAVHFYAEGGNGIANQQPEDDGFVGVAEFIGDFVVNVTNQQAEASSEESGGSSTIIE